MRAFISLRTQYENLGDEVIGAVLVGELCRRMPVTALAAGVPEDYIKSFLTLTGHPPELTLRRASWEFYTQLLGHGLGREKHWVFTSPGDTTSTVASSNSELLLRALLLLPSLRLATVGASFGRLSVNKAKLLAAGIARSRAVTVRDQRSQALARDAGAIVPIVPDLAFLLPRTRESSQPLGLISLRRTHIADHATVAMVGAIADRFRHAALKPAISWQVGRDRQFCAQVAEATGLDLLDFPNGRPSLDQASELYRRCRLVVSNRLHVLLIAAAAGSVCLPLLDAQESKVRGAFETVGLAGLICQTEHADVDIESRLQRLEDLDASIHHAFARSRRQLVDYFDSLVTGRRQTQPASALAL